MANPLAEIRFPGHDGSDLSARLDRPAGTPNAYALFAHCFTGSKELSAVRRISQALAQRGIAVLRFDFTGLGSSEGDFANTNFSSNVQDLVLAADYLRQHFHAPALLIGHSLGGAAVLAAAGDIPEVQAVATIGAPSDPDHVKANFAASEDEIRERGEATVKLGGRQFTIKRQFLDDIAGQVLTDKLGKLGRALLIFHSPVDRIVAVKHARHLYQAAKHPKSYVSLDDADHLLTQREDAEYVASVLSAWATRYLRAEADATAGPGPGEVLVSETAAGPLNQRIRVGRHDLTADELEAQGGDDAGPNPYEYLLASLGACAAMTVRRYAERHDIPLYRASATLRYEGNHIDDCDSEDGCLDRIRLGLSLAGDLDAAQLRRLADAAAECPVHRALTRELSISVRLNEDPE